VLQLRKHALRRRGEGLWSGFGGVSWYIQMPCTQHLDACQLTCPSALLSLLSHCHRARPHEQSDSNHPHSNATHCLRSRMHWLQHLHASLQRLGGILLCIFCTTSNKMHVLLNR
jgi:hypothetical protein